MKFLVGSLVGVEDSVKFLMWFFIVLMVVFLLFLVTLRTGKKYSKRHVAVKKTHTVIYSTLIIGVALISGVFALELNSQSEVFIDGNSLDEVTGIKSIEEIEAIESLEHVAHDNSHYLFGIDVSHYQGEIKWHKVKASEHPIEFVFIRSTMGVDGKDTHYHTNWVDAKAHEYIRGAYHYYRPNENSTEQFENFASTVTLVKGDFPPILDIEEPSRFGDKKLREGVLNWLKLAEAKYGIKPVVYTGKHFYDTRLKGYLEGYPLWIAAYSGKSRVSDVEWTFHQFSEEVNVAGIDTAVDGNSFNLTIEDLKRMCIGEDHHSKNYWKNYR
ncbi:GH25 family lysozyme [Tamlana sp. 2_MG-2023]|uniref:glycoside hydrolase family 25 protein n=1 Tax=unclassified Tamlana TaxID=2614803 RepID=UPI0026E144CE|nr:MULTISPECIES: GH25 family lysozyme [unclassified Tamlana]MDO6760367.1 GH25 family lysozyme [Tamlana sp. 2_MG-2023]MDO6789935.1 GH25 family lysozyme [Tamlana sp. 1_MG-2023]